MKRPLLWLIVAVAWMATACNRGPEWPESLPPIKVYFSPDGGCTEAIVCQLDAAAHTILVQAYSFTSHPIAEALVRAHRRGLRVEVLLDEKETGDEYSLADVLFRAGVATLVDARHPIAHNKVMILDSEVVITGSFNFTHSAETHNAENLLIIRDRQIAEKYTANWKLHAAHAEPYVAGKVKPQRNRYPPHSEHGRAR